MDNLRTTFETYFEQNQIHLPEPIPNQGTLKKSGWLINYCTGTFDDGTAYLDFFAQNRQTNSRHMRILENGDIIPLEHYQEALIFNAETGDDWAKASEKQHRHNQKVTAILEAKGLL